MPTNPCDIPVLGSVCDAPGQVLGSAAGSAWDGLVGAFVDGVGQATRLLVTFWTTAPTPDLERSDGPVQFLRASTSWYTGALAVGAFLVGAARIALTHRGEQAALLGQAVLRLIAVTFVGVPAVTALLVAGDGYSDWILDRATGGDFSTRVTALTGLTQLATGGAGSALVFLLAVFALVASVGQMGLLFIRGAMVTLLVGGWPLAASVSNTEAGGQWFRRSTGWLVAFVAYKPAAATVYAAGFISADSDDPTYVITGVFLIGLSVVTLPALLRLAVPATAAVAAGGGGGATAAAVGALATGAVTLGGVRAGSFGGVGSPAGGRAALRSGPDDSSGSAGLRGPSGSRLASGGSPGDRSAGGGGPTGSAGHSPSGAGGAGTAGTAAAAGTAGTGGGPAPAASGSAVTVIGQVTTAAGMAAGSARRAADGSAGESDR